MQNSSQVTKRFILSRSHAPGFAAAVLAAGALNPMENLGEVGHDLQKMEVVGKVVFDLLLANGNKTHRFFVGEFDGQHFTSVRFEEAVPNYAVFSQFSAQIIREHLPEIDTALLPKAMLFALRQGIPF